MKWLEMLKIFSRFTYIQPLVVPGNLLLFFNLKFEYLLEFSFFRSFACKVNQSPGNFG